MNKIIRKRLLSLLLALVMVFSLAAVTGGSASAATGDTYDFRILFTSDLHGSFSDYRYSAGGNGAGLARIATQIEARRSGSSRLNASTLTVAQSEARTMLIDVGDSIQGNGTGLFHGPDWDNDDVNNTAKMYPVLYGMELLKYDVWVLGNHEFNFDLPRLDKAYGKDRDGVGQHGFTGAILAGNVYAEKADNYYGLEVGESAFDAFYVKKMPDGGPNVAVIGMTHSEITQWDTNSVLGKGLNTITAAKGAQKAIAYLKSPEAEKIYGKIDVFVGAMHVGSGNGEDAGYGIINMNRELDLFLGAHGHSATNNTSTGVRFMELDGNGNGFGSVDVRVTKQEDGSWKVVNRVNDVAYTSVSPGSNSLTSYRNDPGIVAAHNVALAYSQQPVGTLSGGPLVATQPVRGVTSAANIFYTYDTALNHLFFDSFMYAANEYVAREDADWITSAGDRSVTLAASCALGSNSTNSLQTPGPITRAQIGQIYNYDNNTLCIIELTGYQLKVLAEYGFTSTRSGGNNANQFISGVTSSSSYNNMLIGGDITYTVDMTKATWNRITDMRNADGTPFDMDAVYWLAANNHTTGSRYLAAGDSYPASRLKALPKEQQLLDNAGELLYEAEFDNYGEYTAGMPIIRTFGAQEILTLDGAEPINNGEGATGVVADYILRKLGGNLTNAFTPNWRFDTTGTPSTDWVLYNKAVEVVNANIGINYNGTGTAAATPANIRGKLADADVQALWDLYSANIAMLLNGRGDVAEIRWTAFADAMTAAGAIITASGTSAAPVPAEVAKAPAVRAALEAAIAGLTAPVGPVEGEVRDFTVFFTSDLHGSYYDVNFATVNPTTGAHDTVRGLPKVAALLKSKQAALDAAGKSYLTVDVGDTIEGKGTSCFIGNPDYENPMIHAFNYLGYDAVVLGNHEFNYGVPNMYMAYNGTGTTFGGFAGAKLAGNVFNYTGDPEDWPPTSGQMTGTDTLLDGFKAYEVFDVDGIRVAVVGMTHTNSMQNDMIKLKNANAYIENITTAATRAIREIRDGNLADVIVLAGHSAASDASPVLNNSYIAANVDVYLGAHGHSKTSSTINGVKFGENAADGATLGEVKIQATYEGGKWVVKNKSGAGVTVTMNDIATTGATDAAYLAEMKPWADYNELANSQKIGTLVGGRMVESPLMTESALLTGSDRKFSAAYIEPTAMVEFIHDVQKYFANAEVSIACPFSPEMQHYPGDITRASLGGIYRYDSNTVYRLEMKGWQLKNVMEYWVNNYYNKPGSTQNDLNPTHSTSYNTDNYGGVRYVVDLTASNNNRVSISEVKRLSGEWEAFDPNETYIVAANDFRTSQILSRVGTATGSQEPFEAKILETDCTNGKETAPDIISLMAYYVINEKGGVIDATDFEKNWSIKPWWDEGLRAEGERLIVEGKIPSNALPTASRALTRAAVLAALALEPKPEYTITFVTNGGTDVESVTKTENSTIDEAPVTTRAKYAFEGWYTDEALTEKVTFPYTVTGNATLYANWIRVPTKVVADIRGSAAGSLEAPVEYIISLLGMEKVLNASITFEVDGSMLEGKGLELLSSAFTALDLSEHGTEPIRWTNMGGGVWQGEILLMNFAADGFSSDVAVDVAKVIYAARQYGDATMKLTKLEVVGIDENDKVVYLNSEIKTAEATTSIVKVYSIFDLNKDGVIDALDLGIVQRYYLSTTESENWDAAKVCDFDGNGIVNMLDLIQLFLQYAR